MDVLELRNLSTDVNFLYKVLQLDDNPIRLVGTGSMASQYFPADYDFLCVVKKKYKPEQLNNAFKKIISQIDDNKLFFIEFKIQEKQKNKKTEQVKQKVFKKEDVNINFFEGFFSENTELCKIDCILWNEGKFKEVSCIYFFDNQKLDVKKYIRVLLDDGKQYYNDGKVYKSLKRLMLAAKYKYPIDKNLIIAITRFFNSATGQLYEVDNMLQACIIYMNKYGADARVRQFLVNIGLSGMNPDKIESLSKEYQNLINGQAMLFYKLYRLPVGELPPYNSIVPIVN
jgi:hypothetical protein